MTLGFDLLLLGAILVAALWVVLARDAFEACIGNVVFGLLLSLAWIRLGSVDVGITEAAIGAGIGGVLLLNAATRLRGATADQADRVAPWQRAGIAALCTLVAAGLAAAVLALPVPAPSLAAEAVALLPPTGLGNPVTGVLMVYRGLDTLLEAAVVIFAVIAVWSLSPDAAWGGRPGPSWPAPTEGPLTLVARLLPPVGLVIGIHIVWTGADAPGGKFQGGAVLAAMWILPWMAGLVRPPPVSSRALRLALVAGPALFLLVAFAGFVWAEGFLALPAGFAKPVILLIEVPLTLSIALGLALLLLGPPDGAPSGGPPGRPGG